MTLTLGTFQVLQQYLGLLPSKGSYAVKVLDNCPRCENCPCRKKKTSYRKRWLITSWKQTFSDMKKQVKFCWLNMLLRLLKAAILLLYITRTRHSFLYIVEDEIIHMILTNILRLTEIGHSYKKTQCICYCGLNK